MQNFRSQHYGCTRLIHGHKSHNIFFIRFYYCVSFLFFFHFPFILFPSLPSLKFSFCFLSLYKILFRLYFFTCFLSISLFRRFFFLSFSHFFSHSSSSSNLHICNKSVSSIYYRCLFQLPLFFFLGQSICFSLSLFL